MSDEDDTKKTPADAAARAAIVRAISPLPVDAGMDAATATAIGASLTRQTEAERETTRLRVVMIHGACFSMLAVAVVLRVTVLQPWPDVGGLLISGALFAWGQMGFKPSEAVLAKVISSLEQPKLERMLSLRPPEKGNTLRPPPLPAPKAAP